MSVGGPLLCDVGGLSLCMRALWCVTWTLVCSVGSVCVRGPLVWDADSVCDMGSMWDAGPLVWDVGSVCNVGTLVCDASTQVCGVGSL